MARYYRCSYHVRCYGVTLLLLGNFAMITILSRTRWLNSKPAFSAPFVGASYNVTPQQSLDSGFYGYSGSTELKQYREFIRRNPTFVLKVKPTPEFVNPPGDYGITVSVICGGKPGVTCDVDTAGDDRKRRRTFDLVDEDRNAELHHTEGVFFSIAERHNGDQQTSGGSSFRITSTTSVTRQMCSYVDMFDGTYVVWCPLTRDSECSNLSVSLDFFNFTAYTGHHKPLRDVKWRQTICRQQLLQCSEKAQTLLRRTDLDTLQCETARRNAVAWQRQNDMWQARLSWQRDYTFQMNKTALCERLKHLGQAIFIGASHMRYKSDHIVSQCYELSSEIDRKHSSLKIGNVEYIRRSYAEEFQTIPAELSKRNLTNNDLVLVQTGTFDMYSRGLQKSLTFAVPVFSRVLREIHDLSRKRGFRVVFVTSPSFPRSDSRTYRGNRNNFALAAFNGSVKKEMADIGVEIFDEFSAFLAYEEEVSVCGEHYLCRTFRNDERLSGELGKTAAELLLTYATS